MITKITQCIPYRTVCNEWQYNFYYLVKGHFQDDRTKIEYHFSYLLWVDGFDMQEFIDGDDEELQKLHEKKGYSKKELRDAAIELAWAALDGVRYVEELNEMILDSNKYL